MPDRAAAAARHGALPGPVQGIDQTVLRMIAALRSGGQTFHRIAALLNRCGIAAPLGGRWYGASVRQALIRQRCPVGGIDGSGPCAALEPAH